MGNYIKVEFEYLSNEQKEILIALLSELNYEGFEEEADRLKAYIPAALYDPRPLKTLAGSLNISFSLAEIENKNWNQLWESNFNPVVVTHATTNLPWVGIRADFHKPIKNVEHELIITPKMSFGTGHHPTSFMMMKMMSELDFAGKRVLDFGTGTGILAILAEKLEASVIIAIDSDTQSIINATENFESNKCTKIQLLKQASAAGEYKFDIILANIIKTVIKSNLEAFVTQLIPGGIAVFSGLLKDDEKEITDSAMKNQLFLKKRIESENWICLQMVYEPDIHRRLN